MKQIRKICNYLVTGADTNASSMQRFVNDFIWGVGVITISLAIVVPFAKWIAGN